MAATVALYEVTRGRAPATAGPASTADTHATGDARTIADPGAVAATAGQDPTPDARTTADPGAVADVLAESSPPASNARIARVGAS